jgi:hypothetical protein
MTQSLTLSMERRDWRLAFGALFDKVLIVQHNHRPWLAFQEANFTSKIFFA